jgi:hypothetical protein
MLVADKVAENTSPEEAARSRWEVYQLQRKQPCGKKKGSALVCRQAHWFVANRVARVQLEERRAQHRVLCLRERHRPIEPPSDCVWNELPHVGAADR